MTSEERRCKKNTIVQEYTQQTKTATAAVEQEMRSQIAGMNCNDSLVLASIHLSVHEMVELREQLDSRCPTNSEAPAVSGKTSAATTGEAAVGRGC